MRRARGLLAGLLLAAGVAAAALIAWQQIGRSAADVVEHARQRLQGHPVLASWATPVLDAAAAWLDLPDTRDGGPPFVVPPLPPNPATAPAAPSAAADPRILRVGPTRALQRIEAAARIAVDGSVIEIDPGDYVADVAVWTQADLVLRGLGDRVRLIAAGAHAEGKAIWVFRGRNATVENISFVGARVPDRNGAGIRLERGRLTVRGCSFLDNETGLLTSDAPGTQLEVVQSEFGHNGHGDGFTHGLYVGRIDSLRLTGNHFHHANVGHLVKSRARWNRIEYNRITDGPGGRASYELELPNGGVAEIVGNLVQQARSTRNSVLVSYGAEGYTWPQNTLHMAHNTLVNDAAWGGTFVRVASGATEVVLRNNLYVGSGRTTAGAAADTAGDRRAHRADFLDPGGLDYRLSARGVGTAGTPAPAPLAAGLLPRFEPAPVPGALPLWQAPRFAGALQTVPP
ncbi:right-handed parallel beta-helix repeat-containing protein [Rubrivivax sp. RP6-9]|uniref:right-handed parallel beta-helix repeat-containing protein n=1 Tax=Rubrivivax sp. RP6-9 TaxID=3415750 RepID=UPI003CC520C3